MSNNFITMSKLRQILKMYSQGKSKLFITETVGVSRNTVKNYLRIFHGLNKDFEEINALPEKELDELFKRQQTVRHEEELKELYAYYPVAEKKLSRRGTTIHDLWLDYEKEHPNGLGKTAFYVHYNLYKRRQAPSMHIEHKAGEKMFIDYAGETYPYLEADTGDVKQAQIFAAVLGASRLTYFEAIESQTTDDLILCCIHSLEYFGGAPLAIVPDNLKAAVIKASRYSPQLNQNFEGFAKHYNMAVVPARAYKPKDKALVENAVKLSYQRILKHLGNDIVVLTTVNERIKALTENYNNANFSGRDYSRRSLFEESERATLQPLPPLSYELRKSASLTVFKTGHIFFNPDKHYYSVPYQYIGKKVKVLYSKSQVEIFYKYESIAFHKRVKSKFNYTTEPDHMASQHKAIMDWNPEKFLSQGRAIHADVEQYLQHIFEKKLHPEQAYRSCAGILSFARRKGNESLRQACTKGLQVGRYSYKFIESILLAGTENLSNEPDEEGNMPSHDNIRNDYQ
jgi:transposase